MIERKLSNNFTPERIERKLFRKSPLGTRIADDIISPLSTKELLSRKKTQARKIYLEGEELKTIITRNYTLEKIASPLYKIKMPFIKISKRKKNLQTIDYHYSDDSNSGDQALIDPQKLSFPDIAEVF